MINIANSSNNAQEIYLCQMGIRDCTNRVRSHFYKDYVKLVKYFSLVIQVWEFRQILETDLLLPNLFTMPKV